MRDGFDISRDRFSDRDRGERALRSSPVAGGRRPQAAVLLEPGGSDDSTRPLRHPDMPFPPSPDSDIALDVVGLLRNAISDALLRRLDAWRTGQWPEMLKEIQAVDALGGKMVRISHPDNSEPVEGQACGYAQDGSLLVKMLDGPILNIRTGHVSLLT